MMNTITLLLPVTIRINYCISKLERVKSEAHHLLFDNENQGVEYVSPNGSLGTRSIINAYLSHVYNVFRQSAHVNVCSNLHNTCVTQDPVIVNQPASSIHTHPPSHCK